MMTNTAPLSLLAIDNDVNVHRSLTALTISHPQVVRSVTSWVDVGGQQKPDPLPDVVVVDFWLGRDNSTSLPKIAHLLEWGRPVILYTSEERPAMLAEAVSLGISALSIKHDGIEQLVRTLDAVARADVTLSRPFAQVMEQLPTLQASLSTSEGAVLRGLAYGLEVPEIAERLHLSPHTVRTHERNIRTKYAASLGQGRTSRQQILRAALKDGYWDPRMT